MASLCTFVTFLFQLMLKQKRNFVAGPLYLIHVLAWRSLYLTSEGYSFLLFFFLIHMGILLSFLWLNHFNSCSDIMTGRILLFPRDRKSVLKTSDVMSPLPLPSHWSSGQSSAGHSHGQPENSRQHYPLELSMFWELCLDSKDQNFAFCSPSTCISEKREF